MSNVDVVVLNARKGELRDELQSVLFITVPLTALACALTTWLLLRLRREIIRRAESEEVLKQTVAGREDALRDLRDSLEREQRLRRELDHRVRNNLSSLLGLFDLYESAETSPHLAGALRAKIAVLRDVYGLIGASGERGVDLRELLATMIETSTTPGRPSRFELSGPSVALPPREANAFAMIAQELVTNSAKYGALRHPKGTIRICWSVLQSPSELGLSLRWLETPIAPAPLEQPPQSNGIGLELIRGFARSDLRGGVHVEQTDEAWIVDLIASIPIRDKAVFSHSLALQEAQS